MLKTTIELNFIVINLIKFKAIFTMEQHSPTNPFKSLQGISLQPYPRLTSTDEPSNYDIMLKTYLPDSPDTAIFFEDDEDNNINLHPVTKTIQKTVDLKKKYSNISNALRLELLDAVENQGEKIKHVQLAFFALFNLILGCSTSQHQLLFS